MSVHVPAFNKFWIAAAVVAIMWRPVSVGVTCAATWTGAVSDSWGSGTNWDPLGIGVPDTNTESAMIAVNPDPDFNTDYTIGELTINSNGDLDLNGFRLIVQNNGGLSGQTTVTGPGTGSSARFTVRNSTHAVDFDTDLLAINSNGELYVTGANTVAQVDQDAEVNNGGLVTLRDGGEFEVEGELTIYDTGEISGEGVVQMTGSDDMINNGTIRASSGTLILERSGSSTAILDMDGIASETGALVVDDDSALIIDIPLSISNFLFDGAVTVGEGAMTTGEFAELQINTSWRLSSTAGTRLDLNGGAGTALVSGSAVTSNGAINVNSGTARFDVTFTGNGGTISNDAGTLIFAANATINNGCTLDNTNDANYVVDGAEVIVNADDFDMDGFALGGFTDWELTNEGILDIRGDHLNLTQNDFNGDLKFSGTGVKTLEVDFGDNNIYDATWLLEGPVFVTGGNGLVRGPEKLSVEGPITVSPGAVFALANETTYFSAAGAITGGGTAIFNRTIAISDNTTISVNHLDADGGAGTTTINISPGATLTIDSNTIEAYSQSLFVADATLTVNTPAWTIDSGNIILGNYGFGGATFSGSGVATFQATASLDVRGTISTLAAETVFEEGAQIALAGGGSELDVNATITLDGGDVTETVANGTLDLNDAAVTVTGDSSITTTNLQWFNADVTIEPGAVMDINVTDFDTANNENNAIIRINSGVLDVQVAANVWQMDNSLYLNNTTGSAAHVRGDRIEIGDDIESLDTNLVVGGSGISQIAAAVTFYSDADVHINGGAVLETEAVTFESVNASEEAEFTGSGQWHLMGTNIVNEATTIDMAGGTVELDNAGVAAPLANDTTVNAALTINAAALADYGSTKTFIGTTFSDLNVDNEGAETGTLTVNLDHPKAEWTLLSNGRLNLVNGLSNQTLLFGSDVNLNGTTYVTGDVTTAARVDVGGIVNINTAGQYFRLNGGNNTTDPNTISGGTIDGAGALYAYSGSALFGYGTINTDVEFFDTARLIARGGQLEVDGTLVDVGRIGTVGSLAVLDMGNAWNTNVADEVLLQGGQLRGAEVTNDLASGIEGYGEITARVVNNTRISATLGGTLRVVNANWDGEEPPDDGELSAEHGNLELVSTTAKYFGFDGTVRTRATREALIDGFDLGFRPASSLLMDGGTVRANTAQTIGGLVQTDAVTTTPGTAPGIWRMDSTIANSAEVRLLEQDLQLYGNTVVRAGAEFEGPHALVNLAPSMLTLADGVNLNTVPLVNQGALAVGASPGTAFGFDFIQAESGIWYIELGGTTLGDFDRLILDGGAQLGGVIDLALIQSYVPRLGETLNILSANAGISGSFFLDQPATMPAGLMFEVNQLGTIVQLEVVDIPILEADFDEDGDVDDVDLDHWQAGFGTPAAADHEDGDADGDRDVDGADLLIWQRQLSSTLLPDLGVAAGVPEPASGALLLLALLAAAPARGRANRRLVSQCPPRLRGFIRLPKTQ